MSGNSSRLLFPEDRTAFVFQAPGKPILTPPRTGLKLFLDEAGTQAADILTEDGSPIPHSTIYTDTVDSLYPIFQGPEGFVHQLWGRVVGGLGRTYPVFAQYSDQLGNLPQLLSGDGPPGPNIGSVGSYYIDRGIADPNDPNSFVDPVIYGPRTSSGWPSTGVHLIGPVGPSGAAQEYQVPQATDVWDITHHLDYRPNVTTVDSADEEIVGDVSYPGTHRVVIRFGSPISGTAILS